MTVEEKIRELSAQGLQQKEICERLGLSRGRCQNVRRKLGLTGNQPGVAAPQLTESQKANAIDLLRSGTGYVLVAKQLGIRQHAVRQLQEAFVPRGAGHAGRRARLTPATKQKVLDEIAARQNFAKDIAAKYHLPYSTTKRLAHRVWGPGPFVGGAAIPLTSRFPQKNPRSEGD